jgi:hypothetical protein
MGVRRNVVEESALQPHRREFVAGRIPDPDVSERHAEASFRHDRPLALRPPCNDSSWVTV